MGSYFRLRRITNPNVLQSDEEEAIMAKTEVVRARINPELKRNVELPNEETRDVFEKTDRWEELVECKDADDMFEKLNI